ncbi:MAG: hypothetical protein JNL80_03660 [Phycisphaerae bacterium]|nr:hypothetical protein [Phycisphaerae bacterium]
MDRANAALVAVIASSYQPHLVPATRRSRTVVADLDSTAATCSERAEVLLRLAHPPIQSRVSIG